MKHVRTHSCIHTYTSKRELNARWCDVAWFEGFTYIYVLHISLPLSKHMHIYEQTLSHLSQLKTYMYRGKKYPIAICKVYKHTPTESWYSIISAVVQFSLQLLTFRKWYGEQVVGRAWRVWRAVYTELISFLSTQTEYGLVLTSITSQTLLFA